MAHWTDNRKCLGIGCSGLQYRRAVSCFVSQDDAAGIVTRFFRGHGAVPCESSGNDGRTITFTRGSKWVSWFTWLLPVSERWPMQTISVRFKPRQPEQPLVADISYDVRMFLTLVCAPNALVREAAELQGLLRPG